ncbi:S8 family serine peptidase [uncultured Cohaesibacter sp.]|uniref:S8 family serine peptidase n=1 Tax=uncultured Cohaesibacter sp. TaxID=1002546 RepID=UPI00374965F2
MYCEKNWFSLVASLLLLNSPSANATEVPSIFSKSELRQIAKKRDRFLANLTRVRYIKGEGIVGADRAFFRASSTSFAAPIVSGTASLILSRFPDLNADDVKRMLLNFAGTSHPRESTITPAEVCSTPIRPSKRIRPSSLKAAFPA